MARLQSPSLSGSQVSGPGLVKLIDLAPPIWKQRLFNSLQTPGDEFDEPRTECQPRRTSQLFDFVPLGRFSTPRAIKASRFHVAHSPAWAQPIL
jgi:hypothetical protein